jgi:hypothetical protein
MVLRSDGGHILSSMCYQDCDARPRKEHHFEEARLQERQPQGIPVSEDEEACVQVRPPLAPAVVLDTDASLERRHYVRNILPRGPLKGTLHVQLRA